MHFQKDFLLHGRNDMVVGVVLSMLVEGCTRDSSYHGGLETEHGLKAEAGVTPKHLLLVTDFCHPGYTSQRFHSLQSHFQKLRTEHSQHEAVRNLLESDHNRVL